MAPRKAPAPSSVRVWMVTIRLPLVLPVSRDSVLALLNSVETDVLRVLLMINVLYVSLRGQLTSA